MKVLAKLAEFLQNENGGMSSRRLFGFILIGWACFLSVRPVSDNAMVLSFLTAGSSLLGLTTADSRLPQ